MCDILWAGTHLNITNYITGFRFGSYLNRAVVLQLHDIDRIVDSPTMLIELDVARQPVHSNLQDNQTQ